MLSVERLVSNNISCPSLAKAIEQKKEALCVEYKVDDFDKVKKRLIVLNEHLRNVQALGVDATYTLSDDTKYTVSQAEKDEYDQWLDYYLSTIWLCDTIEKAEVLQKAIAKARSKKPANAPSVSGSESSTESELSSVNDETEQALFSLEARAVYALLGTFPKIESHTRGTQVAFDNEAQRSECNLRALGEEAAEAIGHGWIDAGSTEALGVELRNVGWAALGFLAVMLVGSGLLLAIAASGGAGIVPIAAIAAYCGFGLTSAILAGTPLSVGAATMLAGSTVLAGGTLAGLGVACAASYADSENQVAAAGRALHQSLLNHQSLLKQGVFAIKASVEGEDTTDDNNPESIV